MVLREVMVVVQKGMVAGGPDGAQPGTPPQGPGSAPVENERKGWKITTKTLTSLIIQVLFYLDGHGVALLDLPGVTHGVHLSPGDGFAVGAGTGAANSPGNLPGCAVCIAQCAVFRVYLGTGTQ